MRLDDEFEFYDSAWQESNKYHEGTGRDTDYCTLTDEMLEEE